MTAKNEYQKIKSLIKGHNITLYALSKKLNKSQSGIKYSLDNEVDKIGTICDILGAVEEIIKSNN